MNAFTKTLLALACVGLPATAWAQSNDSKYCAALGERYNTYVLGTGGRSHNTASPDVASAISKCSSDAATAIPILEKALNDAKAGLPPRG